MEDKMENKTTNKVSITDIKMPFWSMVAFITKAAIAAIPAFIILLAIGGLIRFAFSMIFPN